MSTSIASRFSISSRTAAFALSMLTSLAASASLVHAEPSSPAPAAQVAPASTVRWGFATLSANDAAAAARPGYAAPQAAQTSELAATTRSGYARVSTSEPAAATTWGYARLSAPDAAAVAQRAQAPVAPVASRSTK